MIEDVLRFSSSQLANDTLNGRAIVSFINFLERKLGVSVVKFSGDYPFSRPDLAKPLGIAQSLFRSGIVTDLYSYRGMPDEPPVKYWKAKCGGKSAHGVGGASFGDDEQALYATLAEALERYLWSETDDYFEGSRLSTVSEIARAGAHLPPERFASFSQQQRAKSSRLHMDADTKFLWIRGTSLITGASVYVPAQTVSGKRDIRQHDSQNEPIIRMQITNGLATSPTRAGALLHGALEIIERDAYMIMWLNHLTLPRLDIANLCETDPQLKALIDSCQRYHLKVHVVRMITDAPTHAVCVILEDGHGNNPRFGVGLKANRSLARSIEGGIYEALRGRLACRHYFESGHTWDLTTSTDKVGHRDRLYYWGTPEHAPKMEFLVEGNLVVPEPAVWEKDNEKEHLARIIGWCKQSKYALVSVPLTRSKMNVTPWHVEMVLIPELQPVYLFENLRQLGGERIHTIPKTFGYKPRTDLFLEPHPFS